MPLEDNDYLPLPIGLTIKKSKLHGLGLFAIQGIPKGQDLGITHIADDRFPNEYMRTPLGGFINYSALPNCDFIEANDTFRLKTLRTIKKGQEITADYRPWYDEATLSSFKQ